MNAELSKTRFALETVESPAALEEFPVYWRRFFVALAALAACFCVPLYQMLQLAFHSQLYSYLPLIPVISVYFAWQQRKQFPHHSRSALAIAGYFFAIGLAAPAACWFKTSTVSEQDFLAVTLFSFVAFVTGAAALFLGRGVFRTLVFPLCFLIFMVPLPVALQDGINRFLQVGSAAAAHAFFNLAGMPVLQDGLRFDLPGLSLHVAPECSGIHSSLVLLITSVVAARVVLHSPWMRAALVLFTVPLALVRNGFRIWVIGELCVHRGIEMLNSPIHRHGGPLFFALSLIPLFALLIYFRRREGKSSDSTANVL
ncbi:MAG TPA: exosortase [Verrucomicrobiae bacterium]|nr:exosortase [Verrucomicrobiae bacterium]